MFLHQHLLKSNKNAIEKYKDRIVKIYSSSRNVWFFGATFCIKKADSSTHSVIEALEITKKYHEMEGIQFHFEDLFGDDKMGVIDFEQEDVYNCPNVVFENYRPL